MTCQIFRNSWYFTQKISLKKKFLYFKLEEKTRNYKEAVSMSFRNIKKTSFTLEKKNGSNTASMKMLLKRFTKK